MKTLSMQRLLFDPVATERCEAFIKYHVANPGVYRLFRRFTLQVIESGRSRFGVRFIGERIRWHCAIEQPGSDYRINNNFWPYYSRLLMLREPLFSEVFERRDKRFDTTDQDLLSLVEKAELERDKVHGQANYPAEVHGNV